MGIVELKQTHPSSTFSLIIVTDGDDNTALSVTDCQCHGNRQSRNIGGGHVGADAVIQFIEIHKLDVQIHILGIGQVIIV